MGGVGKMFQLWEGGHAAEAALVNKQATYIL